MKTDKHRSIFTHLALVGLIGASSLIHVADAQEVVVFADVGEIIDWFKAEEFWGEESRTEQLAAPYLMLTGIHPRWRETSQRIPVDQKKELFYRFMLPLILHANRMVLERRAVLLDMQETVAGGGMVSEHSLDVLRLIAVLLRVTDLDTAAVLGARSDELAEILDEALHKLDEIPAGLALGQAAYESGYGTSRFAIEGNGLFGQWTLGGEGLVPEQRRTDFGDYRIAIFDWPFDSVRDYFINLMSHPAYAEFRQMRAELRSSGQPLDSLRLADGLVNSSERDREYVETLKDIIRTDRLDIADDATLRDEPMRFAIGAEDEASAQQLRSQIETMRSSGELAQIIDRMRLE